MHKLFILFVRITTMTNLVGQNDHYDHSCWSESPLWQLYLSESPLWPLLLVRITTMTTLFVRITTTAMHVDTELLPVLLLHIFPPCFHSLWHCGNIIDVFFRNENGNQELVSIDMVIDMVMVIRHPHYYRFLFIEAVLCLLSKLI